MSYDLNLTSLSTTADPPVCGKFAADARRETRSCISIPQVSRNKADAANLSDQNGEQKQIFFHCHDITSQVTHNIDKNRILCP